MVFDKGGIKRQIEFGQPTNLKDKSIKKTTPHLDDQNGNFRVRTAVVSVDENQKKITDFFSHVTKDESPDSLARSLARCSVLEKLERLEFLEKRLKEMESTEARLIQENQQLRAEKEKEQISRKSEKKISKSNTNNKQNIKPKKKSNTGPTPPTDKEELGEKQSETVKKGKKSKVIDLESCSEAERRYEPAAAWKPIPYSINIDPELKSSPPSQLSQPSRSKSNKAKIFVAGNSIVKDVKGWLLSRETYVKVYSFSGADTEDMSDFYQAIDQQDAS